MDAKPLPRTAPTATEWKALVEARTEYEPNTGCWLWAGPADRLGYGRVHLAGFTLLAHRASYYAARGDLPALDILHACDTPACVNPDHLRPGTHQENMDDRGRRGRSSGGDLKGEDCPWSKIGPAQVRAIRSERRPARIAAPEYGISTVQFYRIKRKERWSHVA